MAQNPPPVLIDGVKRLAFGASIQANHCDSISVRVQAQGLMALIVSFGL